MRRTKKLLALAKRLDVLLEERMNIFFEERPYLEDSYIILSQLFSPSFEEVFRKSEKRGENETAIKKTFEEINKVF